MIGKVSLRWDVFKSLRMAFVGAFWSPPNPQSNPTTISTNTNLRFSFVRNWVRIGITWIEVLASQSVMGDIEHCPGPSKCSMLALSIKEAFTPHQNWGAHSYTILCVFPKLPAWSIMHTYIHMGVHLDICMHILDTTFAEL